jgi:hypothetical protein
MNSLLVHGVKDGISPIQRAFECSRAEFSDGRMQMRDAAFCPEIRRREVTSWFAGRMRRQAASRLRPSSESLQFNSSPARSLLQGLYDARRHIAVLLSGLLSQSKSGSLLQNAQLGTWESSPFA